MTITESPEIPVREPRVWPLSAPAYRALGELGLIPEKTELLYGRVFHKIPKSPLHRLWFMRLLQALQNAVPQGCHVQPEQPSRSPAAILNRNLISRSFVVR